MAKTRRKETKRAQLQGAAMIESSSSARLVRLVLIQVAVIVAGLVAQKYSGSWGTTPGLERQPKYEACGFGTQSGSESGSGSGGVATRFALYSERVVTPQGTFPATVGVENGVIVSIQRGKVPTDHRVGEEGTRTKTTKTFFDYGNLIISPGMIDLHVHVNEPGRETWEGFRTATAAAAAGGVTSLFDMPLNSKPAAVTGVILREKVRVARDKLHVDVGFWGGLVPENADGKELLAMLDVGAVGFKAFMSPSGIDDFGNCNETHLTSGLRVLSRFSKPLMVHAEVPFDVELDAGASPREYGTYMRTRPGQFEVDAIRLLFKISKGLSRENVAHKIHVAHVSHSKILDEVQVFKNKILKSAVSFTVETCPHYLFFESESIPDGATQYKCAPPIRDAKNRKDLWNYLRKGTINTIGSDHSPSPPDLKHLETGNFLKAWGGIAGLQYSLPATWTAASELGASIEDMAEWWSYAPAAIVGLADRGAIEVGKKADFVVWDDRARTETGKDKLFHRHKLSPYNGLDMKGKVEASFVSGHLVFSDGQVSDDRCGRIIRSFHT